MMMMMMSMKTTRSASGPKTGLTRGETARPGRTMSTRGTPPMNLTMIETPRSVPATVKDPGGTLPKSPRNSLPAQHGPTAAEVLELALELALAMLPAAAAEEFVFNPPPSPRGAEVLDLASARRPAAVAAVVPNSTAEVEYGRILQRKMRMRPPRIAANAAAAEAADTVVVVAAATNAERRMSSAASKRRKRNLGPGYHLIVVTRNPRPENGFRMPTKVARPPPRPPE